MGLEVGVFGSGQETTLVPDPGAYRDLAQAAEDLGFASLWAGDHLAFENPIHESLIVLGFLAASTRRIRLGTAVYLLPLRPPAAVAKQVASLAVLSEERLVLGVGVGGEGAKDFEAVGVDVRERGARTDEAITVVRRLLAGPHVEVEGRFTRFADVSVAPRPQRPVPIWVGGRAPGALARAGRLGDGWIALFQSPEGFARSLSTVRREAVAAGRDPDALVGALVLPTVIDDDVDRARRRLGAHLSARYGRAFEPHVVQRYGLAGDPETCARRLAEYQRAGVRHVVVNPGVEPHEREGLLRRLHDEVLPGLTDRAQRSAQPPDEEPT